MVHTIEILDFVIKCHEDGNESVKFLENQTKTHHGGLRIIRTTQPQIMWSTDVGEKDPV